MNHHIFIHFYLRIKIKIFAVLLMQNTNKWHIAWSNDTSNQVAKFSMPLQTTTKSYCNNKYLLKIKVRTLS